MTQRRGGKRTKPEGKREPRASHVRALAVIDEVPIRREAMETYQRLETQIAQARAVLEAFETGDLPAYQRWEARAFGSLLTQIRELTLELQQKDLILHAIDEEMYWSGCTDVTAYRRVTKALEEPPPEPQPRSHANEPNGGFDPEDPDFDMGAGGDKLFGDSDLPPGFDAAAFDRLTAAQKREFRMFYEDAAMLFELETGRMAPRLDDVLKEDRARKRGAASSAQKGKRAAAPEPEVEEVSPVKRAADRLKELYRKLVLQLHPDHHGEQTARDRELWHQLQTAYKNKDLELMEALAGRIELTLNRVTGSLPVQVLLRLTRELRDSLRGLRAQIASAKLNPAWEFRKKAAKLPQIEAKRRKNLEYQIRKLKMDVEGMRSYLDALAERASRTTRAKPSSKTGSKKKSSRRTAAEQASFDF